MDSDVLAKRGLRFFAGAWLAVCVAEVAKADELLWLGGASAAWNTSDLNWSSQGETVAFAPGSDVRFDDSTSVTNVTFSEAVSAGSVVFSNSVPYLLAGSNLVAVTKFIKSGPGTLRINNMNHTYAGDLLIEGGELISDANNDAVNATWGTLGNPRAARTITVTNDAALTLKNYGTFGGGHSTSRILTTLNIVGGTLNMPPDCGNIVGPVIFDNAKLTYSGGQPVSWRYWGTMTFGSNVVFRGTNVYNFPVVGNESTCGFTFGKYEPSDLVVADITGNANSDVIFGLPIGYTPYDNGVNTRFTKKGPGTLELSYPKNFYTGDVSVAEGTLFLNGRQVSRTAPYSPLGNPRVPHRLYVGTNAVLHFNQSDVMGQAYSRSLITIEVDGGTLKQTAGKVNSFGPLVLNNAKLDYSGHAAGNVSYQPGYYTNAANVVTVSNQVVSTTSGGETTTVTNQISANTVATYLATPIDAVLAQYTNRISVAYTNFVYQSEVYEVTQGDVTVATSTNVFLATYTNVVTATLWLMNAKWGTFYFDGDVAFKGTNAYTLANNNTSLMRCGINGMVYFTPDDITGNANVDVTVSMPIDDGPAPWGDVKQFPVPSNFGKRGPGTLSLANHASTFSGDIDVAEGVLLVPYGGNGENKVNSCVGNPQVTTRTLLVRSGGELSFMQSDTLGQLASSVKMATVVSNATLRLANGTCNGFGPLTFHNAKVIYNGGTASSKVWGVMGLGGRTVFEGTNAYTFAVVGSNCRFSLGYSLDFSVDYPVGKTNYNGKTEFVVRDITADANPDVTFEAPLQDIPAWPNSPTFFKNVTFKCGLLKSGSGTLRLASTDNSYSGPTLVTQGVLRVDGSLSASAVTVKSGGFLGGTGTVADVTLEDGAGFDVLASQTVPLKVSALTANGGVVRVRNQTGLAPVALNAPFLQVAGGFDASKWTVAMDGVEPTVSLRVRVGAGGVAYVRWSPPGTAIFVR
ncbi:MAG TPA: autotransporter-associated beta strand repeat-containing protein [Kiritimatiellia bacterium]|nr:autotransporter-associated beta strand repeat-containing protein [Kiritimatiellia bacterium]